jgi:hypothetical protein
MEENMANTNDRNPKAATATPKAVEGGGKVGQWSGAIVAL